MIKISSFFYNNPKDASTNIHYYFDDRWYVLWADGKFEPSLNGYSTYVHSEDTNMIIL